MVNQIPLEILFKLSENRSATILNSKWMIYMKHFDSSIFAPLAQAKLFQSFSMCFLCFYPVLEILKSSTKLSMPTISFQILPVGS